MWPDLSTWGAVFFRALDKIEDIEDRLAGGALWQIARAAERLVGVFEDVAMWAWTRRNRLRLRRWERKRPADLARMREAYPDSDGQVVLSIYIAETLEEMVREANDGR